MTTDKYAHGYMPDYTRLLDSLPDNPVICEVGVLSGESLDMWREMRPGATLIAVDSNENARWPAGTHRIVADQADPTLPAIISNLAPTGCDLIVDDASHIGYLTEATLRHLWPLVRAGCFYVIEDWADPWVDPTLTTWPQVNPTLYGHELVDYVPHVIHHLRQGAQSVAYTREGLVIIQRAASNPSEAE